MSTFKALGKVDHRLVHAENNHEETFDMSTDSFRISYRSHLPSTAIFTAEFREPQTMAECQDRLFELRQDIHKIRQQLNDRQRQEKMDINEDEYRRWRHKAIHARNTKIMQQQSLSSWLESQRVRRAVDALNGQNPVAVLGKLVDIINDVRQRHRISLTADELNIVSLADNIVNNEPSGR